jgi:hypothetical protein
MIWLHIIGPPVKTVERTGSAFQPDAAQVNLSATTP